MQGALTTMFGWRAQRTLDVLLSQKEAATPGHMAAMVSVAVLL